MLSVGLRYLLVGLAYLLLVVVIMLPFLALAGVVLALLVYDIVLWRLIGSAKRLAIWLFKLVLCRS